MDERLARLEELTYFQDEKLNEMDKRLLAQQLQLDALERRLETIDAALREVREYLLGKRGGGDEKPPHYEAW